MVDDEKKSGQEELGVKMSSAAKKSSRLWAIFGILFLAFFLYVIYAASQGTLPFFIRRLYMFPGGDKLGHFILLG
ncbi:MAG: hypothetical protein WBM35_05085, partial [Candidatus Electrothrix sp.]